MIGNDKYNKIENVLGLNNEGFNCLGSPQYGSIFLLCELKDSFGICFNHHFNTYVVQHEKISSLNNVFKKHLKINAAVGNTYTESTSGKFPFSGGGKHVSMTEE